MGSIPTGMCARHTCDNRWCIHPDHIIVGTKKQNNEDRKERGGYSLGEKHVNAKLTSDQVIQIRKAVGTLKEIAERFGSTEWNVQKIRKREAWRHI